VAGENLVIEWRHSDNLNVDSLDGLARELVDLRVDVIVAVATARALAAKRATSSIPIVFISVSDPVQSGLVASLGHPGGNATGLADLGAALSGKRLELLRDMVPGAVRIGYILVSGNAAGPLAWRESQTAAPSLGLQLVMLEVRAADELEAAFEAAVRERVDALMVQGSADLGARAAPLAAEHRLPATYTITPSVYAGGLMAYAPSVPAQYRRAATYVDKILKGTRPADLPVEQPREFDFIINLKTAQALGLTIPQHVLLQATEVLQ
jgi:putative ABC transport system substrate-binding protein